MCPFLIGDLALQITIPCHPLCADLPIERYGRPAAVTRLVLRLHRSATCMERFPAIVWQVPWLETSILSHVITAPQSTRRRTGRYASLLRRPSARALLYIAMSEQLKRLANIFVGVSG